MLAHGRCGLCSHIAILSVEILGVDVEVATIAEEKRSSVLTMLDRVMPRSHLVCLQTFSRPRLLAQPATT